MKNIFKNYESVGPLSNLLIDNDGNMQLGLFKKILFNKLVLILKFQNEYFVLNPSQEQLDAFFRNEITLIDIVYPPDNILITSIDNRQIANDMAFSIYNYIASKFSGTLSQQLFFTTKPYYYSLYRDAVGMFSN